MTSKLFIFWSRWTVLLLSVLLNCNAVASAQGSNLGISGTAPGLPDSRKEADDLKTDSTRATDSAMEEKFVEPPPGQRLTMQQVWQLLRSTRDLSGRNLSGMNLTGINLSRCNLRGADMSRANLERADFTESNLERVDFSGANLKMASFFQAAVTAANLEQAQLGGAIWQDKQVCSKGSLGKCLVTPLTAQPQPTQTTATTQPAAQTAGAKTPAPADKPAAGK